MAETPAVNQRNIPKGLAALLKTCNQIYPDQQNPLQVTTILKFWLGGEYQKIKKTLNCLK